MIFFYFNLIIILFLHLFVDSSFGTESSNVYVIGYRVEPPSGKALSKLEFEPAYGAFRVPRGYELRLRIYGTNMTSFNSVAFTRRPSTFTFGTGDNSSDGVVYCDKLGHSRAYTLTPEFDGETATSAVADVYFDTDSSSNDVLYYFCLEHNGTGAFVHQGSKLSVLVYHTQPYVLPLPLQLSLICFCLTLSWLFSGLNLGLMSLDCTELQLITRCGSDDDRRFAKALEPIRRRGNTLLCTILLTNTIVNSSYTLLLDDVVGEGIYALIGSTVGIVIFGEILPQAVCSRYGLKVGYYTRWIVQFFMYALYPLTLSIGKLLDCVFGHEIHQVYSRDKLREIVMMSGAQDVDGSISAAGDYNSGHLKPEEVKIVTGALQMNETRVRDIMKGRNEIFMLDINEVIDYDLIALIARNGYTRIPIYANGDRDNIVGLLNAKDLLGIDPEDKLPLNSLIEFYGREVIRVEEDRSVLAMLNTFKEAKVHLAIVDHVNPGSEDHDPWRVIVGVVTLEDVIEFILRDEIVDETDVLKDVLLREEQMEKAVGVKSTGHPRFMGDRSEIIPHQLCTAATQFLMANVEPFRKEIVERKVLARLLRFPGIFVIKKFKPETHSENFLYSFNQPADFFALILQGSCHVYIGREQLPFEAGPFHYFGLDALTVPCEHHYLNENSTPIARNRSDSLTSVSPSYCCELSVFRPDFTVEITSDVQYVRLTLAMYRSLISVTRLARLMNKCDDPVFVDDKLRLEMQQNHTCSLSSQSPSGIDGDVTPHYLNGGTSFTNGCNAPTRQNSLAPAIPSNSSLIRLANLKRGSMTNGSSPERHFSTGVEVIKPQRSATTSTVNGVSPHHHGRSGSLMGINRFLSTPPTKGVENHPHHTSPLLSKRFLSHLQSSDDISHNRAVPDNNRNGGCFTVGSIQSFQKTASAHRSDSPRVDTVPRREPSGGSHRRTFHGGSCESLPTSPYTGPLRPEHVSESSASEAQNVAASTKPRFCSCSEKNGANTPLLMVRKASDGSSGSHNQRRRSSTVNNNNNNGGEKNCLNVPGYYSAESTSSSSISSSNDQIVSDDAISLDFQNMAGSYVHM